MDYAIRIYAMDGQGDTRTSTLDARAASADEAEDLARRLGHDVAGTCGGCETVLCDGAWAVVTWAGVERHEDAS